MRRSAVCGWSFSPEGSRESAQWCARTRLAAIAQMGNSFDDDDPIFPFFESSRHPAPLCSN